MEECFSRILNCTNGIKSRNAPHMMSHVNFYKILKSSLENIGKIILCNTHFKFLATKKRTTSQIPCKEMFTFKKISK